MKLSIVAGATSQSVTLFLQDSSQTNGAGLTGLTYNSAGLICYYTFAGANAGATSITLATLAAVNSAWSSGGFKEVDATHMPGIYRFDVPNAVIAASNGRSVVIMFTGATNLAPTPIEIELTGIDNQDGTRGGMTALPNAAANANGGLPILSVSGTTLAYTVSTLTTYTGNTPQTGDAFARIGAAGDGLTSVALASNGADGVTIESGLNLRQAISVMAAVLAGVDSGADSSHWSYAGAGVSTNRVMASGSPKRSTVTINPPA